MHVAAEDQVHLVLGQQVFNLPLQVLCSAGEKQDSVTGKERQNRLPGALRCLVRRQPIPHVTLKVLCGYQVA